MSTQELALYGGREDVREMSERLIKMLPSVRQAGESNALMLAQAAVAHGLNPFLGELWLIPQRNKQGQIVSYSLMAGIKGHRRAAHNATKADGGFYKPVFRPPTEDELNGVTLKEGDVARACDVMVFTETTRRYMKLMGGPLTYTGIGIYRAGEYTRMEGVMVARKRAEADALKQAFDLPFGLAQSDEDDVVAGDWQEAEPERRDPAQDMEDLFGKQARADFEAGAKPAASDADDPTAYYDFLDRALSEIGYYNHRNHLLNVMQNEGWEWAPDREEALIQKLKTYATRRADEKAAAESGDDIETAAEIAEQEAMPF